MTISVNRSDEYALFSDTHTYNANSGNSFWISRRMKKKSTLDVDVFCIIYRHGCIHSAGRATSASLGKRKRDLTFQSLPKYISLDDLPKTVCYRDIELFFLKDPESKCDVLCAIIEFRNLKGRPEGAD